MYWRILKRCILRISTSTLSKSRSSLCKAATVLIHERQLLLRICPVSMNPHTIPQVPKLGFSELSSTGPLLKVSLHSADHFSERHLRLQPSLFEQWTSHTPPLSLGCNSHVTDLCLPPFPPPPTSSESPSQEPLTHHCLA